jgi:hypothetical protein
MHDDTEDRTDHHAWWALAIGIVAALVWSFLTLLQIVRSTAADLHDDNQPAILGAVFGHAFVISAIIGIILYFAFLRRWAPRRGLLYFLIILVVASGATYGGLMYIKSVGDENERDSNRQAKIAMAEMHSAVAAVTHNTPPSALDMRVSAKGDAGIAEGLEKHYLFILLTDRQDFFGELKALGFPGLLAPQSLAADRHLAATRGKLVHARQIVAKYAALSQARVAEMRSAIVKSPLGDPAKSAMLAAFDRTIQREDAHRARLWTLEDSIMLEYQRMVALLAHPRGDWTASGRIIRFANPADLADYKTHIRNVKAYAAEAQLLHAAALQSMNDTFSLPQ